MIFDGEDDGEVVFPPFCLLHTHFQAQIPQLSAREGRFAPLRAAHTQISRELGHVLPSTPAHHQFVAFVAPRGALWG